MADYNVSQLEDTDGNLAKILAKRLESAIQIALSGDVSGTSAATVLDGDVAITLTIGAKKVKNTHIDDDAVRAKDHRYDPAFGARRGDIPKADGGHDGEAVPQGVPEGRRAGFLKPQYVGEGYDQEHQAEQDHIAAVNIV